MRRLCFVLSCLLLCFCFTACSENTVVGVWEPIEPSAFYFELFEDRTCVMFDQNDEWLSSGTYKAYETYIAFETDTGSFTWVWDKESESMVFESGGEPLYYRKTT